MKSSTGKFELDIPCDEELDYCNLTELSVTENGTYMPDYNHDGFYRVNVNVSGDECVLTTKAITENGVYNASSDNADGYSSVTVALPDALGNNF